MVHSFQLHPSAAHEGPSAMELQHQQAAVRPSAGAAPMGRGNQLRNSQQLVQSNGYSYPPVYHGSSHSMTARSQSTGHHHHSSGTRHHFPPAEPYMNGSRRYTTKQGHYPPHPPGIVFPPNHCHSRRYTPAPRHVGHRQYETSQGRHRHPLEGRPREENPREEPSRLPPSGRDAMVAPLRHIPPLANTSVRSGDCREVRSLPLRTVAPNKGRVETPITKKPVETVKPSRPINNEQENRGAAMNFMKSPVTMCFERMLGAASYLANNPTPDHVKKQLALTAKNPEFPSMSPATHECKNKLKRKSLEEDVANDTTVEGQSEPKRGRGLKPFLISSEEAEKLNQLGQQNPFVQLLNDEKLYHHVILLMTLEAETKDVKKLTVTADSNEPVSLVIGEGFKWRDYPQLEQILHDQMRAYYSISVTSRQSKLQQKFNNQMVVSIREAAAASGCSFTPDFNDKKLRDRIRCFYKTHLQNAKKRLATMQKHPTSVINQSHLRGWIREAQERMNLAEPDVPGGDHDASEI